MRTRSIFISATAASLLLLSTSLTRSQSTPRVQKEPWGKADGREVFLYTLRNGAGFEVKITNYGGTITTIETPDRNGKSADVVLGFDRVDRYASTTEHPYFGATIGRYGNRIAKGTFTLDGHSYHIPINNNGNALHGGLKGFDRRVWDAKDVSTAARPALELHYLSRDGEEGFPGNLDVTVRFSLSNKNELRIDYSATTDKDTVLNLTNHSYFNLSGAGDGPIVNDKLTLNADRFTPTDATLIPTGVLQPVAGTPFDFRKATIIGARIDDNNQQLKYGGGYDHNWVLNHSGGELTLAARVEDPNSGRVLEVLTTQPGVQFYTANSLNKVEGVGGAYHRRTALCLETQHFPDSPNHANFPSTVLHAGEHFHSTTIFRFSTE